MMTLFIIVVDRMQVMELNTPEKDGLRYFICLLDT
jgi:hypothetical protein